jgi:hypothetical protein
MSQATAIHPMLFGEADEGNVGAFRWLSPVLIGLSAPIVFGLMMFPSALENASVVLTAFLLVLLLICIAAYTVSVFVPGEVSGLLVDRGDRQIELITNGMFATGRRAIVFEDIADLRMAKQYDHDGYAVDLAELRLIGGEVITLPSSISPSDINVARRALGLTTTAATRR